MTIPPNCPSCSFGLPRDLDKPTCPHCGAHLSPAEMPAAERPSIGKALVASITSIAASGDLRIGDDGVCQWTTAAPAKLEHDLCPILAQALGQPLQLDWIVEAMIAVQLVEIEQKDQGLVQSMRAAIATYLLMSCQQLPWPVEPKTDEEKAETGDASAS